MMRSLFYKTHEINGGGDATKLFSAFFVVAILNELIQWLVQIFYRPAG